MDALEIRLLGWPEVSYLGQPVKFATRKTLGLFAYLVVESDLHPREKLMTLFWPESPTQLAQSALRNTLARLKDALQNVNSFLRIEADRIGFNFSSNYTLDLALVNQALSFHDETNIRSGVKLTIARSLLPIAAAAPRGPFLDGFSLPNATPFDEWINNQRVVWSRRYDLIFDQLSLQQMEEHQSQAAIITVTRWLSLDRLNEVAYRRLMRLHYLNGDVASAVQTYNLFQNLLGQELGVEPTPQTKELLTQIQMNIPILLSKSTSPKDSLMPLHIPFVGRSPEYQQLMHIYRQAIQGKVQVVYLVGEAGIGKTRLATEFLGWVGTEGADILHGQAINLSNSLHYQPVIAALRQRLERENAPEDLLDDTWLSELTPLLPELRERYPDLPQVSNDETTTRDRLFEAITRLSQALAARRPLVWLLDDFQWADPGSLELLHYLAQRWQESSSPIMLLILLEQDALNQDAALRHWLTHLDHLTSTTRLPLIPMNTADLQRLVESLAGERGLSVTEFAGWLFTETGGQPFLLAETLVALDEHKILVWVSQDSSYPVLDALSTMDKLRSQGSPAIVPTIQNVILARLGRLSLSAETLLAAAAVLNSSCTFSLLCQVGDIDESTGLNALDELLRARLLHEACDEARPYTIAHYHIREVVYAELHQAHQQVYHRRALASLAVTQAPAAELAHHAIAAREWQSAFRYHLEAGDEALRLSALEAAIRQYEAALHLLREAKVNADDAGCHYLYTGLSRVFEAQGRGQDAVVLYEDIQTLCRASENQ